MCLTSSLSSTSCFSLAFFFFFFFSAEGFSTAVAAEVPDSNREGNQSPVIILVRGLMEREQDRLRERKSERERKKVLMFVYVCV